MTPRKQTALQALVGICAGVGWTAGFAWLIARDTAASSTGDQPLIPWGLMAWCGAMGLFVGAVVDPGFRKMQYAPPETPPTLLLTSGHVQLGRDTPRNYDCGRASRPG